MQQITMTGAIYRQHPGYKKIAPGDAGTTIMDANGPLQKFIRHLRA
jgi:hypothetical protein